MTKEQDKQKHIPEMTLADEHSSDTQQSTGLPDIQEGNPGLEEELLNHIARSKAIFKSQQKDDPDLKFEEKLAIARNSLETSHCQFLSKFGNFLKEEHLKYFENSQNEDYEVSYHVTRLQRYFNNSKRQTDVKNRRYQALKNLVEKGEYFSECEMMKRNPLLYEHLVGQYMTEKQKKARDNIDTENITFVNLLMESMDRDIIRKKQKIQEEEERNVLEESDSDEEPRETDELDQSEETDSHWGQIPGMSDMDVRQDIQKQTIKNPQTISKHEMQILKQEFISNMYQSFLEGKDTDFDYSSIDNNEDYDNIDLRSQDEEEKYFDSESPEAAEPEENSKEIESEDELDVYMKSLKVK